MSPDGAEAVTVALARIEHRDTRRASRAMGEGGTTLARQYSPDRWASNLLRRLDQLVADVGRPALPGCVGRPGHVTGAVRRAGSRTWSALGSRAARRISWRRTAHATLMRARGTQ